MRCTLRFQILLVAVATLLATEATGAADAVGGGGGARGGGAFSTPSVQMTGRADPALAVLDHAMAEFVQAQKIPGMSVAISRRGRLVYARGFGYADVDTREPVQPTSLFRIASISKPITAVAVMQLTERKKLTLNDRAFELLGLAPHLADGASPDPRIDGITIRQLLQHTSGWDQAVMDPMFRNVMVARELGVAVPPSATDVIRFALGRPLDFEPGTKYAYANLNYNVLGRVIEKASGMPYEQYIREKVMRPLGIRSMRLGRTLKSDRAPGEVTYYESSGEPVQAVIGNAGERVPQCYGGWSVEILDSHGGWVASAPELVRFASAFDNFRTSRLLSSPTIKEMIARPAGPAGEGETFYACGWEVRPLKDGRVNMWHGGRLKNSLATLLVRRADGLDYAILCNTYSDEIYRLMDATVRDALAEVKAWPAYDLFPALLAPPASQAVRE